MLYHSAIASSAVRSRRRTLDISGAQTRLVRQVQFTGGGCWREQCLGILMFKTTIAKTAYLFLNHASMFNCGPCSRSFSGRPADVRLPVLSFKSCPGREPHFSMYPTTPGCFFARVLQASAVRPAPYLRAQLSPELNNNTWLDRNKPVNSQHRY